MAICYDNSEKIDFCLEGSHLSGRVISEETKGKQTVSVKTTSLSNIVNKYKVDKFILVSDVEGMEIPIFLKEKELLKKCQQIFLEIDGISYEGVDYSIDDIIKIISDLGFELIERYYNCVAFNKER